MVQQDYDDDIFEMLVEKSLKGEITPSLLMGTQFAVPIEDAIDIALRSAYVKEDDLIVYFDFLLNLLDMNLFVEDEEEVAELKTTMHNMSHLDIDEKHGIFTKVFSYYLKHRLVKEIKSLHIDDPGITPVDGYTGVFINKVCKEVLSHLTQISMRSLH